MRKLLLLTFFLTSFVGLACEHCNVYLNISPGDFKNSFGIFKRSRTMLGDYNLSGQNYLKHASHNSQSGFLGSQVLERYNIYEVRGNFYFKERWNTIVVFPFVQNIQYINDVAKYNVSGAGDPMFLQRFQLYNTKLTEDTSKFVHRVTVGIGLKMPLGSIDREYLYGKPNLDLQPGTGSWDALGSFSYVVRKQKIGLIFNSNIKLNSANENKYQYGNTTNVTANVFCMFNLKEVTFVPFFGAYYESAKYDRQSEIYSDTGGNSWYSDFGFKLNVKNILLTSNVQFAFENNLNGTNQLVPKARLIIGLNYLLK